MNAKKTIEDVPCKLTAEEQLLKSKQLCILARERATVDEQKKASAAMYKSQADSLDEQIKELVQEVHTGEEMRPIECFERPRYGDMLVDIVRTDTGALHRVRPMHPDERQLAMDSGEVGAPTPIRGKRRRNEEESPEGTH